MFISKEISEMSRWSHNHILEMYPRVFKMKSKFFIQFVLNLLMLL